MRTSRRQAIVLAIGATASLVGFEGLCGRVAHAAQDPASPADDTGWLTRDLFESRCGQSFIVSAGPTSIALRLKSVDDVPTARQTGAVGDQNMFVVVFRGPRSPKLTQGTYWVESRTLGTFQLFLVPGATNASGTTYSATFNRVA